MRRLVAILIMMGGTMTFAQDTKSPPAPDGWQPTPVRDEIAPRFFTAPSAGQTSLGLAGQGSPAVCGAWRKAFPVTAGKHYAFRADLQAINVPDPLRSAPAKIVWLDAAGQSAGPADFPAPALRPSPDGWTAVTGTYLAPAKATAARVELCLRWAAAGQVLWRGAGITESAPPPSRRVRLATVSHYPRGSKSLDDNLALYAKDIERAAAAKADIVCLGEAANCVGINKPFIDMAEPIPGPTTEFLGKLAAKHKLYIVAGVIERDGKVAYNSAVLIGRDGAIAGKYHKVCLPEEEIEAGLCPGNAYPVFDTDFGRIGIMICWDLSYAEVASRLARQGAEVILMPIWGGEDSLARARAVENQVYLVASGYDFKSAIYDRTGQPLAKAAKNPRTDPEVLVHEIDLARPTLWPWLGDWRARVWRQAPEPITTTPPKPEAP